MGSRERDPTQGLVGGRPQGDSCGPNPDRIPGQTGAGLKVLKKTSSRDETEEVSVDEIETIMQKDTCTTMFIAALFTIARTWKQPKCPSTDEWIKKMWYIYTMEYSAIERNEIELFVVRWMDLESVIQSEVSQKEKNKYRMLTHIYGN